MELITCYNCNTAVSITANFCRECGNSVKCRECRNLLKEGAKFCEECGLEVATRTLNNSTQNTLTFHKKGDEISYNVSLSDDVGKEGIKAIVESIGHSSVQQTIDVGSVVVKEHKVLQDGNNINPDLSQTRRSTEDQQSGKLFEENEDVYPHIDDLLNRRSLSEAEWLLVFAFYEGDDGKGTFTKDQVKDAYFGKRKSVSRSKNFSSNWMIVYRSYLTTVREGVFRINLKIVSTVSDFILGKINAIPKETNIGKLQIKKKDSEQSKEGVNSRSSKSSRMITLEEFDTFKSDKKPSLQEMYSKFQPTANTDVFGLIGYYICSLNKADSFTAGNIDYAYKVLKLARKNNLIQLVNNAKSKNLWFEGMGVGIWKLTRLGEVQLEEKFSLL